MAWIRNSLPVLVAFAAFSTVGHAEVLWRVQNQNPAEAMELYVDQITPFPVQEAPRVVTPQTTRQQPRVSPEILMRRKRAMEAANLLSQVREILNDKKAFTPDVSALSVGAIMQSEQENGEPALMVLLNNQWRNQGEKIDVPIVSVDIMVDLIGRIESVDQNLAAAVQEEVEERMNEFGRMQLQISSIEEDGVIFKNTNGEDVVINFVRSRW